MFRWKPAYTVCTKCRVHFEPYSSNEKNYLDLCPLHQQPELDMQYRKNKVMAWALMNWKKLEPQFLEEEAKINQVLQGDLGVGSALSSVGSILGLGIK